MLAAAAHPLPRVTGWNRKDITVLQRRLTRLLPIGVLILAAGLLLHNFLHARYSEFAAGLFIGISAVFIIAGTVGRSRMSLR